MSGIVSALLTKTLRSSTFKLALICIGIFGAVVLVLSPFFRAPPVEQAVQLRGECGARQVPNTSCSLVNGMGGMLSAAGTLVLANRT